MHDGGDFFRLTRAPDGNSLNHVRNLLWGDLVQDFGLNYCRRNCVNADSFFGYFFPQTIS